MKRTREDAAETKFIYFVRGMRSGLVKIGITSDLVARLAELSRRVEPVGLLYAFEGHAWMEAKLHHHFRQHLARGREWFHPDPELLDFIRWGRRQAYVRIDPEIRWLVFSGLDRV